MSDINELKDQINTKTLNLFLLTLVTAGIYPCMWLFRNHKIIDKVTSVQTASDNFVIWIAVSAGLGVYLSGIDDPGILLLSSILSLTTSILYLVWAFKARSALQEYAQNVHQINLKMNGFYTFLFGLYYINYCINDLPEVQNKTTGQTNTLEG